jgi:hypothetical protein
MPDSRFLTFRAPGKFASAFLLVGAAWCASPAARAASEPDPVLLDSTFKPAEQSTKVFRTAEAAALKDVKRAVVPLFSVEFVTADNVTAQTSGFAAAGRASASAYYKLLGVGEADFQALTEAMYAEFLRDLQSAGIEIVPAEQLRASASYRKLAAGGTPAPIKNDTSTVFAPLGMPVYGFNKVTANATSNGLFGAIASIGSSMGAVGAALETTELQKELNAAVLEVQMRVHFVQLNNDNKGFLGRLSNTASVSSNVYPGITLAVLNVQGTTRGSVTLVNPLRMDPAAFADVRDKPTTAGDVASAVGVGILRLALGSRDTSSTSELEVVADPGRYRQVVGAGLSSVNQMFVHRLRRGE